MSTELWICIASWLVVAALFVSHTIKLTIENHYLQNESGKLKKCIESQADLIKNQRDIIGKYIQVHGNDLEKELFKELILPFQNEDVPVTSLFFGFCVIDNTGNPVAEFFSTDSSKSSSYANELNNTDDLGGKPYNIKPLFYKYKE